MAYDQNVAEKNHKVELSYWGVMDIPRMMCLDSIHSPTWTCLRILQDPVENVPKYSAPMAVPVGEKMRGQMDKREIREMNFFIVFSIFRECGKKEKSNENGNRFTRAFNFQKSGI